MVIIGAEGTIVRIGGKAMGEEEKDDNQNRQAFRILLYTK
jgi:hypothetical protein